MNPAGRCEIRTTLPATLKAIEQFTRRCRFCWYCLPARTDAFAAELLLREALTNAVIHGSSPDRPRQVRCVIRIRPGRLSITVGDEGVGFDWRSAWKHEALPGSSSGRGMEIIRKYATRVRFSRNGSSTTIVRRFQVAEEKAGEEKAGERKP